MVRSCGCHRRISPRGARPRFDGATAFAMPSPAAPEHCVALRSAIMLTSTIEAAIGKQRAASNDETRYSRAMRKAPTTPAADHRRRSTFVEAAPDSARTASLTISKGFTLGPHDVSEAIVPAAAIHDGGQTACHVCVGNEKGADSLLKNHWMSSTSACRRRNRMRRHVAALGAVVSALSRSADETMGDARRG
jgi:hypothetical protein